SETDSISCPHTSRVRVFRQAAQRSRSGLGPLALEAARLVGEFAGRRLALEPLLRAGFEAGLELALEVAPGLAFESGLLPILGGPFLVAALPGSEGFLVPALPRAARRSSRLDADVFVVGLANRRRELRCCRFDDLEFG